ncbi:MAG: hypothetical protein ACKN81_15005, partial [Pirellulaceae bacterium]
MPKKPNDFQVSDPNLPSLKTARRAREGKKISIDGQDRQSQIKAAGSFFFYHTLCQHLGRLVSPKAATTKEPPTQGESLAASDLATQAFAFLAASIVSITSWS